jgi:hypothetical protein
MGADPFAHRKPIFFVLVAVIALAIVLVAIVFLMPGLIPGTENSQQLLNFQIPSTEVETLSNPFENVDSSSPFEIENPFSYGNPFGE